MLNLGTLKKKKKRKMCYFPFVKYIVLERIFSTLCNPIWFSRAKCVYITAVVKCHVQVYQCLLQWRNSCPLGWCCTRSYLVFVLVYSCLWAIKVASLWLSFFISKGKDEGSETLNSFQLQFSAKLQEHFFQETGFLVWFPSMFGLWGCTPLNC